MRGLNSTSLRCDFAIPLVLKKKRCTGFAGIVLHPNENLLNNCYSFDVCKL